MTSSPRLTLHVRLEDLVALLFFLFNLLLRIIFRGLGGSRFSPADVLIIIPAVTLLLAKELVHYFMAGRPDPAAGNEGPLDFARPFWEIIRDWFPFLIILLMYYSLWGDATLLMVTTDRDQALMALDQRLFGFQASLVLQRIISPGLTAWMAFAYFFHVINIPLVACFVYVRRPRSRFREMMSGIMVVTFLGLMGYLLVPAIGPMYTLRHQYTVPLHQSMGVFNREVDFMDFARIQRDVFPSLHVAISFVVWLYAYRNSKRFFWILSPLILSLWFSTLYLRYHYLIDVVAGLILAPLCFLLANWLFRRCGEIPVSLAVSAKWAERLPGLSNPPRVEPPQKAEDGR
ncbi:MAG: phosphatase PAP2 family protein [Terriglobia bacterium]|jgi:membrane-associated phospholipid phosphatase